MASRLLIHVEGETEENFVNEVLGPYLVRKGYESVSARIMGNSRLRDRRGGIRPWPSVRRDIVRHLREDPGCVATTMVDFYGLPDQGDGAWPGRAGAVPELLRSTEDKAISVEEALHQEICREIKGLNPRRFVPFVMMHEFEALLFSDCSAFSKGISRSELETKLADIRKQFKTPEDIDDSPDKAPSRRIEKLIPKFQKPLLGVLAVLEIGLTAIRRECPHFAAWINRLKAAI